MSRLHPYTDAQIEAVADCFLTVRNTLSAEHYRDKTKLLLVLLHEAGIEVTFPEPRFYAGYCYLNGEDGWAVRDRDDGPGRAVVFYFEQHDGSHMAAAREHADRLNRENRP